MVTRVDMWWGSAWGVRKHVHIQLGNISFLCWEHENIGKVLGEDEGIYIFYCLKHENFILVVGNIGTCILPAKASVVFMFVPSGLSGLFPLFGSLDPLFPSFYISVAYLYFGELLSLSHMTPDCQGTPFSPQNFDHLSLLIHLCFKVTLNFL